MAPLSGGLFGAGDGLAGLVVVVIARDGLVEFGDRRLVEFDAGLLLDPLLELRIGRLDLAQVREGLFAVEAETIEHHLVKAFAAIGIPVSELAGGGERNFQPKTGQVQYAERAGRRQN